jgi:hypothetical protein
MRPCLVLVFASLGVRISLGNSIIGVIFTPSDGSYMDSLRPTFETFLSEQIGQNFSMLQLTRTESFDAVGNNSIDFVFADPSTFVCLESEFSGLQICAPLTYRKTKSMELTAAAISTIQQSTFPALQGGGVILTRFSADSIRNISDLRGKVLASRKSINRDKFYMSVETGRGALRLDRSWVCRCPARYASGVHVVFSSPEHCSGASNSSRHLADSGSASEVAGK